MRVRTFCLLIGCSAVAVPVLAVPTLRWAAWGLLRREPFADGAPISYWLNQLDYGDAAERERAVTSLDHIEGDDSQKAAALGWAALNDPSVAVRRLATESLGRMAPTSYPVTERLVRACEDKDFRVRLAAAESLGQMPSPDYRVIDALTKLAEKDEQSVVRQAAAASLLTVRTRQSR